MSSSGMVSTAHSLTSSSGMVSTAHSLTPFPGTVSVAHSLRPSSGKLDDMLDSSQCGNGVRVYVNALVSH